LGHGREGPEESHDGAAVVENARECCAFGDVGAMDC
jgi:hypothetical protein